jgi:hypothetical protein
MFAGVYEGRFVIVQTNEDGLRTTYSRQRFLEHATRIVILGDSFVFGFGVRQEAMFSQVLERELRARLGRSDVAVLNAGIISYSPFLERLLLDGVLWRYRPTLVILMLDPTDVGDDYKYVREAQWNDGRARFSLREDRQPWRRRSALYNLFRAARDGLLQPALRRLFQVERPVPAYDYYDFRIQIGDAIEGNRYFIYRHPLDATRPYFDATYDNIRSIARAARALGADFLLVIIPRFHHWNPRECPGNWESRLYRREEPFQYEYFRYFEEQRPRAGFDVYNLLPAFQQTEEFPLVFAADPHWNERGLRQLGRAVRPGDRHLDDHGDFDGCRAVLPHRHAALQREGVGRRG